MACRQYNYDSKHFKGTLEWFSPEVGARDEDRYGRKLRGVSDGEIGLQTIVLSATRQPVTHILDWFHLSMRLRHIERAWEGIRHRQDLNIYLRDVAVHVPRLQHLLWSGYVREATRTVKHLLAQLDQYPGLRDTVIPPSLAGLCSRIHAAIFSFCAGVMPRQQM